MESRKVERNGSQIGIIQARRDLSENASQRALVENGLRGIRRVAGRAVATVAIAGSIAAGTYAVQAAEPIAKASADTQQSISMGNMSTYQVVYLDPYVYPGIVQDGNATINYSFVSNTMKQYIGSSSISGSCTTGSGGSFAPQGGIANMTELDAPLPNVASPVSQIYNSAQRYGQYISLNACPIYFPSFPADVSGTFTISATDPNGNASAFYSGTLTLQNLDTAPKQGSLLITIPLENQSASSTTVSSASTTTLPPAATTTVPSATTTMPLPAPTAAPPTTSTPTTSAPTTVDMPQTTTTKATSSTTTAIQPLNISGGIIQTSNGYDQAMGIPLIPKSPVIATLYAADPNSSSNTGKAEYQVWGNNIITDMSGNPLTGPDAYAYVYAQQKGGTEYSVQVYGQQQTPSRGSPGNDTTTSSTSVPETTKVTTSASENTGGSGDGSTGGTSTTSPTSSQVGGSSVTGSGSPKATGNNTASQSIFIPTQDSLAETPNWGGNLTSMAKTLVGYEVSDTSVSVKTDNVTVTGEASMDSLSVGVSTDIIKNLSGTGINVGVSGTVDLVGDPNVKGEITATNNNNSISAAVTAYSRGKLSIYLGVDGIPAISENVTVNKTATSGDGQKQKSQPAPSPAQNPDTTGIEIAGAGAIAVVGGAIAWAISNPESWIWVVAF
ncbi:MAG: hypothetical protein M1611_02605 [Candidatus Marsarchaeota archaeon]|nr:hypothetical protein [Candidatus Marsarchaeota archaeon]